MTEIRRVHITAALRHQAVHHTTPAAAAADIAEAALEAEEATAEEAVAVQVAEEDSITIKTDIQ